MRPHLILGVLLIGLGIVQGLENLGVFADIPFWQLVPGVFVLFGGSRILGGDVLGGGFMAILGGIFLLPAFGVVDHRTLFDQWPFFLIGAGVYVLLRSAVFPSRRPTAVSGRRANAMGLLSNVRMDVDSPQFEGGDLVSFMGACDLDLREAQLSPEGAVLDVFAFWGGISLRVPDRWSVSNEVIPFMGGAEDKTRPGAATSGPVLVIRGAVIMGGIEVGN